MTPIDPLIVLAIALLIVIGMISILRVHPFIALITAAFLVSFCSMTEPSQDPSWPAKVQRVCVAFGSMAGKISLLIIMGTIIGKCMTESGAADKIVRVICRLIGEKHVPAALLGGGFVLSIPVFYDATFYLLLPLARSIYSLTRKNYLLFLLCIGFGATISHALIPPTPGPLIIAQQLNVSLGVMIMLGLMIGSCMVPCALLIAKFINWYMPHPFIINEKEMFGEEKISAEICATGNNSGESIFRKDATHDAAKSLEQVTLENSTERQIGTDQDKLTGNSAKSSLPEGDKASERGSSSKSGMAIWSSKESGNVSRGEKLPAFWAASLPIVLPVLLISCGAIFNTLEKNKTIIWSAPNAWGRNLTAFLGTAEVALILSALTAVIVFWLVRRPTLKVIEKNISGALESAGIIILITSAGGAFGTMLRDSGIGARIQEMTGTGAVLSGPVVLILAFAITALIKTAQGSTTIAMITVSGIFAAMKLSPETLGFHTGYVAVVIGIGAMVTGWMNDSGFCIFSAMGGIRETDALKSWTVGLVLLGVSGLIITLIMSAVFPMLA